MNLNLWITKISISKESVSIKAGVSSNIEPYDEILIHDLLNALLIKGGDDAAHALADYL